jgi:ABC-type uncharacterized transport system substrate-binding protein
MVSALDPFGVYEIIDGVAHWRMERFEAFVAHYNLHWPRLASGKLRTDDETFREMAMLYPLVNPLRELRCSLSKLKLNSLAVGADARNRTPLWAYGTKTARCAPSTAKYVFGPAKWLRFSVAPLLRLALIHRDYRQQEVRIAAIVSGDDALLAACESGDVYLGIAEQIGLLGDSMNDEECAAVRDLAKIVVLSIQYGAGAYSLAALTGLTRAEAHEILARMRARFHRAVPTHRPAGLRARSLFAARSRRRAAFSCGGITAALKQATDTIPIVFNVVNDPVGQGLVASLSQPGGNLTGFTFIDYLLIGKWLEMIKEIAPGVRRVTLMFSPETSPFYPAFLRELGAAPETLAVELLTSPVHDEAEVEAAITAFAHEPRSGLIAAPDAFMNNHRRAIVALTEQHRLPAIYGHRQFVAEGALISYGPDAADIVRRSAAYVDRILKGEKPASLPVQQPTKYELVINLKTAKALGLDVPPTLLARADEVTE